MKKIESLRKEREDIKKNQIEILELKNNNNWNFETQWTDPTGGWKDIEKNQCDLEDRTVDITHSEQQRELDWKKLTEPETCGEDLTFVPWEFQKMRKRV